MRTTVHCLRSCCFRFLSIVTKQIGYGASLTVFTLAAPAGAAPAASAALTSSPTLGGLQVLLGLMVVLGLMMGGVWLLKRFAPASRMGSAPIRVVGGVSVGGRERVMVVEVADQWIVIGVAPGRVNALSTLPRQDTLSSMPGTHPASEARVERNFSGWLKHTLDKRNGR